MVAAKSGQYPVNNLSTLMEILRRIDRAGYGAYKRLTGCYKGENCLLYIDHVQSDPFAPPSRLRLRVSQDVAGFAPELYRTPPRRRALADLILRRARSYIDRCAPRIGGTGKSGLVAVMNCGQEILERTAVVINEQYVELRLTVGLPARGRTVMGAEAGKILVDFLPKMAAAVLRAVNYRYGEMLDYVNLVEDQDYLRQQLPELGLVAFVGEGALLPRASGTSDLPLAAEKAVRFRSPPELKVCVHLPHNGDLWGMGIPAGVTLIVGGGYHGKSTLLRALERGVYDHIPGDGREWVITVAGAVKIRAEDGRFIRGVDISSFINNLPGGIDTTCFSTANASGSTSQAANIMEALEMGATLLLLDEDTSATNFMLRDRRMQALIPRASEPITPFLDRVRELYNRYRVSTILVVGGAGDYLDVADRVIMMENYLPADVTSKARQVAEAYPSSRLQEVVDPLRWPQPRVPLAESFVPRGKDKIKAHGTDDIMFGRLPIDLSAVEQIVDPAQAAGIALILRRLDQFCDGRRSLAEAIASVYDLIKARGLDAVSPFYGQHPGDYALPRPLEVAAAVNRLPSLRLKNKETV